MNSDHPGIRPHKNKHLAEKFEGMLGMMMVAAIVVLAIAAVYMVITGDSTPSWMR